MKQDTEAIKSGNISLGIEFGSTRVKAVLINKQAKVLAQGNYEWENQYVNGIWTYSDEQILSALKQVYKNLKKAVLEKYHVKLTKIKKIGISAMMHGLIVLDQNDQMLTPFRTWRNTRQKQAAKELTKLYNYPVPERYANAHLYQAVLNQEGFVHDIKYQTTLAGYVHLLLTGEKVIGMGDASGMFPIDLELNDYNQEYLAKFNQRLKAKGINLNYKDIMPKVQVAGMDAGVLNSNGAKLLDPEGDLEPTARFCPPEGDAQTGMVATNSITPKTGNVSVGTSVFAMIVLEKELQAVHSEIDLVTTPTGELVAMVHANNCTSNLNRWVNVFYELIRAFGFYVSKDELYTKLFETSKASDLDAGGLLSYEYLSGEHITNFTSGSPLFIADESSKLNLANFIKCSLYSALSTMAIGIEILRDNEQVKIEKMYGHGGFFKTKEVGQRIMSQVIHSQISVMQTAEVGGAYGIALLSLFDINEYGSLQNFLEEVVFVNQKIKTCMATQEEIEGYKSYLEKYKRGLRVERAAVELND